ncbi:MAG: winged helix-turn-helix domain-containing protein [Acidimicrobiales bacterium]
MDVTLLRWPDEGARRERLSLAGGPRLLLVADGQEPPSVLDCLEDWIRVPAAEREMRARLDALSVRSLAHHDHVPHLDGHGVLRYCGQWAALPPLESRLTEALLSRFGAVASREVLVQAGWPADAPGRNALDVHVLRLRRRLSPLGLAIRTVRSRGYLLEAAPLAAAQHEASQLGVAANGAPNA